MRRVAHIGPVLLSLSLLGPAAVRAQTQAPVRGYLADSSLALLRPLIGRWRPLMVVGPSVPEGETLVAEEYRWVVGGKAIHYFENFLLSRPDSAQVDGLIYWNPATERVELVAVAGSGVGQGHLYTGEFHQLEDGTLERVFDGFYRSREDIPADAFGGMRRRYRQRFQFFTADSVGFSLEWFHDGAWRPFGGRLSHNTLVRIRD
jgi:hypothetical protein